MKIKKFKNGNVNLKLEKSDFFYYDDTENKIDIDKLYNNEITMEDLYFNQVNGYMYLIDYNKRLIYEYGNGYNNILITLRNELLENNTIKLIPLSKKESKQLFIDLENGY